MLRREARRYQTEQPQELILLLFHALPPVSKLSATSRNIFSCSTCARFFFPAAQPLPEFPLRTSLANSSSAIGFSHAGDGMVGWSSVISVTCHQHDRGRIAASLLIHRRFALSKLCSENGKLNSASACHSPTSKWSSETDFVCFKPISDPSGPSPFLLAEMRPRDFTLRGRPVESTHAKTRAREGATQPNRIPFGGTVLTFPCQLFWSFAQRPKYRTQRAPLSSAAKRCSNPCSNIRPANRP